LEMIFEVEFELYSAQCGEKLELERGRQPTAIPYFEVEPCPECVENIRDEGYDEGFYDGQEEG